MRRVLAGVGYRAEAWMEMMITWCRGAALGLLLLAAPGWAALPDPAALGIAAELGSSDRIERWLDEGMPPDFVADRIGSGLMIAAWEGNLPLMELFVARGADVNFTNAKGEQALLLAAWKGKAEAVSWLLDHGARISREGLEWSALHYAVFAGNADVAKLLMERGADVNGRAPNGSTVLMMAAREGHEALAKALLDAGADPSPKNEWGDDALSWAMRQNNLRIAKLVSSPEAFAHAVKAPPQSYGEAIRSVPPPAGIGEMLKQLRIAEAQGKPTAELRKLFYQAVESFKRGPAPGPKVVSPRTPKALVITADRNKAGAERAEVMADQGGNAGKGKGRKSAAVVAEDPDSPMAILHRITEAASQGKPTEELRKQFYEAVKRYKGQSS